MKSTGVNYSTKTEFAPIRVETAANFKRKLILMLVSILPFIYVAFTTILNAMGERGRFVSLLNKFYAPGVLTVLAIIGYALYLHLFKRHTLHIRKTFRDEFHVAIQDGHGNEIQAIGKWSVYARYVKVPYKLGTYQKQLYLTIYCNENEFAVFFYQSSAAYKVPPGFLEVAFPMPSKAPKFITPQVETIYHILKSQ